MAVAEEEAERESIPVVLKSGAEAILAEKTLEEEVRGAPVAVWMVSRAAADARLLLAPLSGVPAGASRRQRQCLVRRRRRGC